MSTLYVKPITAEEIAAGVNWFTLELPNDVTERYSSMNLVLLRRVFCEAIHTPWRAPTTDYRCVNFCRPTIRVADEPEMIYEPYDVICGETLHVRVDPITYDIQLKEESPAHSAWAFYRVSVIELYPNPTDFIEGWDTIPGVLFGFHWKKSTNKYVLSTQDSSTRMILNEHGCLEPDLLERTYSSIEELLQYGLHQRYLDDNAIHALYQVLRNDLDISSDFP